MLFYRSSVSIYFFLFSVPWPNIVDYLEYTYTHIYCICFNLLLMYGTYLGNTLYEIY